MLFMKKKLISYSRICPSVFCRAPLPSGLLSFPNVVRMTSHQGFFTKEALTNIAESIENAKAFMDGNELKN